MDKLLETRLDAELALEVKTLRLIINLKKLPAGHRERVLHYFKEVPEHGETSQNVAATEPQVVSKRARG